MVAINLTVGEEVSIEFKVLSVSRNYSAIVKKLKNNLLALSLIIKDEEPSKIPTGITAKVKSLDQESQQVSKGKIIETKAFPLIVLKLLKSRIVMNDSSRSSDKDVDEIVSDSGSSHISDRDSARVSDSFMIKYYLLKNKTVKKKKDEYLLHPSRYRKEIAKTENPEDERKMLNKISHLDSALLEVIKDIYLKIKKNSAQRKQSVEPKAAEGENVAECVDISGSGLKIICGQKFKKGDILNTTISPPHADSPFTISALIEIRNIEDIKSADKPKYAIGLKYYAIHEQDMEEIVKYTFQLQRDQLSLRRRLKQSK